MPFADVPRAVERWSVKSRVAIYSSGSVEAQRLVFPSSIFGDLTGLISAYFDTHVGLKQASASYAAIARDLKVEPGEVLFLADMVAELNRGARGRLPDVPGGARRQPAR